MNTQHSNILRALINKKRMKYQVQILSILLLMLVSSCKEESIIREEQAHAECMRTETTVSRDGIASGKVTFQYNDAQLLTTEMSYNDLDMLTDSHHHSYNSEKQLIRSYYYSFPYNITQVQTWKYNTAGKIKYYDLEVNGTITGTHKYYYNQNGDLDSVMSVSSEVPTKDVYAYQNNILKQITTFDEYENIIRTNDYTYTGSTTTIVKRDSDKNLVSTTVIETNEGGQQINWKLLDMDGNATITRITSYDEKGNIIKVTDNYGMHGVYEYLTSWKC
jgi:hypothetical protein